MILKDGNSDVDLVKAISDIATEYVECAVAVSWVLLLGILILGHLLTVFCIVIRGYQNSRNLCTFKTFYRPIVAASIHFSPF